MKRIYSLLSTVILLVTLCIMMAISASAATAPTFQDVTEDFPWYDGIAYAAENGIVLGTGNNNFSPDAPITARQWAVMICRAYDKEVPESADTTFGQAQLNLAYKEGWLNVGAMIGPDIEMCRSAVYESAFAVADLDIYRYELYDDGEYMSAADNYIRMGYENGLCTEDAASQDLITRGEAVQIIYLMQTKGLQNDPPEMIDQLNINNVDQINLQSYLFEFQKIPEAILDEYLERGWTFHVNSQYLVDLSERLNMQCAGVTVYQQHAIYARQPYSTVHEFGHFYHERCVCCCIPRTA